MPTTILCELANRTKYGPDGAARTGWFLDVAATDRAMGHPEGPTYYPGDLAEFPIERAEDAIAWLEARGVADARDRVEDRLATLEAGKGWDPEAEDADRPTLADRLRRVLDARGETVAGAARLAGMPRQVVHKIASGANDNPKIKTLEAIVGAVGATMGELFADEE